MGTVVVHGYDEIAPAGRAFLCIRLGANAVLRVMGPAFAGSIFVPA
jgi:hypothetical protein